MPWKNAGGTGLFPRRDHEPEFRDPRPTGGQFTGADAMVTGSVAIGSPGAGSPVRPGR